ncbi:hypothetical protein GGH12_002705 [Coemansia sp. RSA 1822]|nr:hypothetical protein LPJ76_005482 [Coemansia sp. RSA 638]KAJ2539286.1 hypothetical protein GGF49_005322 [Coemansia sp. RSA 1853]KAJ2563211.1 hypothetical protein GGH12_002705 [Coemansia sp. RSA 1822]
MYLTSVFVVFLSIFGAYHLNMLSTSPNMQLATTTSTSFMTTPRLRILTQNMFMRPPLIKNNKSDWKDARLDYFIEHILPNYDVVCLQEMFEFASSRRSRLFAAAEKLGFAYYVASERQYVWSAAIDGGLVILSRFPIVAHESLVYRRGMGPDWIPKKGVEYAKIAAQMEGAEATYVHVFTTHTQASYGEVVITQPDVKRRLAQLFEFHEFMERVLPAHRDSGEPVVLTGDFNVDSRNHVLTDPKIAYERDVEDGVQTSDEGAGMMSVLQGHGIDPQLLGPDNKDTFKGKTIIELHDTLRERLGYHPVTFGNIMVDSDGTVRPRETVLTTHQDNMVMHSIDYVMWHNPDADSQKHRIVAKIVDVGVTPNFTPGQQFTQISDHYGVSAEIHFSTEQK